jgi:hypothetical protein
VVIADSNFRLATELPADWEVHVYPGMQLNHLHNLIESSKLRGYRNLKNIIVSVGINNRSWSFTSVLVDINKVYVSLQKTGRTAHFVGISTPPGLLDVEKDTIRKINEQAKHRFGQFYIPALAPNEVSVSPTDKYKIHYDYDTVAKICREILNHFLYLTDIRPKPGRQSL